MMTTKTTPKGWMLTLLSALFLLSGLTACSSTEDSTEDSAKPKPEVPINDDDWQTIPVTGGTITKDSLSITFPSGTFSKETKVAITKVNKGSILGDQELSTFYQLIMPPTTQKQIRISIKSEDLGDDVYIVTHSPGLAISTNERTYINIPLETNYSNGEYSVTLPIYNNGTDPENQDITFGLGSYIPKDGGSKIKTRNVVDASGSIDNIQWICFDCTWLGEGLILGPEAIIINECVSDALVKLRARGFWTEKKRYIPIRFKECKNHGEFVQDAWSDDNNSIIINRDKINGATINKLDLTRSLIHELLHYFQSEFDPRWVVTKAKSGNELLMLYECGAVWSEKFANGTPSVPFMSQYFPIFIRGGFSHQQELWEEYWKASNADDDNKDPALASHGYGMSTLIEYFSQKYGNQSIVEIYKIFKERGSTISQSWNGHTGSTFEILKEYAKRHSSNLFDGSHYDDFILELAQGKLIDISATVLIPDGLKSWLSKKIKGGNEALDYSDRFYPYGCSVMHLDMSSMESEFQSTKGSLKEKQLNITQDSEGVHTYLLYLSRKGGKNAQIFNLTPIKKGQTLVVNGEDLENMRGADGVFKTHFFIITTSDTNAGDAHESTVTVEFKDKAEESKPASVSPTSVSFEAEGGKDTTVKINKGSYKYCDAEVPEEFEKWLSAKASDDGMVSITAQPNTGEEREGKIKCWVSNKENPRPSDKKYIDPSVTVTQKAGDSESLLDQTDLVFPVEGGAKFIGYNFGTYLWMKRNWDDDTWLRTSWSKDYLNNISYNPSSDNRFANQLYVCCFPNETGKEREQAITFSYSMIKGFEFDKGDKFPVKIKQEGGSFNMEMMKNFFVGTWYTPQDITYSNGNYYHRRYTFRSDNTFTFEGQTTKSTSKPSSWEVEVNSTYSILNYEVKGECVKVYIKIPGNDGVWYKGLIERWPHFIFFAYENTDGSLTHGVYMEPE